MPHPAAFASARSASPARARGLPRLRHRADWRSVACLLALPALAAWQWVHGFSWWLYLPMLGLTLALGAIHHNHAHRRLWRGRRANRATDFAITLLQGHPSFVFWPAHVGNHHRFRHGPWDIARTWRFGGDTNHGLGYLLHPVQAAWVLYPLFLRWLAHLARRHPGAFRYCMAQYGLWLGSWALLLALDWRRALVFVILPQLHGLHWLLATNYLQHAHADGRPGQGGALDYARNFEGRWFNRLLFNVGFHTAHHENPHAHWTELPGLHAACRHRIDPRLNEPGLARYMLRVYLLGAVWRPARSRPLMPALPSPPAALSPTPPPHRPRS